MIQNQEIIFDALSRHLVAVAIMSGVPLLAAAVVGLIVSLFQAVTQIQDQILPQLAKVVAIALVLIVLGPGLSQTLMVAAGTTFDTFWITGK